MNKTVDTYAQSSTSAALTASGDQLKQIAEQTKAWGDNVQLRQIAEQAKAWSDNAQLRQIAEQAKAWGDNAQLRQIAEQAKAWGDNAQLRQIAEQAKAWSDNAQLRQIAEQAKAWGDNAQLRQIAEQAKAWSDNAQLRQIAEQAKAWGDNAQLRQIAEQARAWSDNAQLRQIALQTLPGSLTFHELLSELVARSAGSMEQPPSVSIPDHVTADAESSVSIGDYYTGEIIPSPKTKPVLSEIPSWLLYLWLICILPALHVLNNWEAMRISLVDINARLPQTSSFSDIRRFIRSNLAGKPGDIRLVAGSDVRLRVAPGMKSAVILTLPKNAPVVVLGKEDRTWLYVSYEHEGFVLDGYVSTKFLKRTRK